MSKNPNKVVALSGGFDPLHIGHIQFFKDASEYGKVVVILNSDLYAHSIIGLNIPSSGRYKYYNGKRYYTWETTAKGYDLGILPADFSNIKYWYVALT